VRPLFIVQGLDNQTHDPRYRADDHTEVHLKVHSVQVGDIDHAVQLNFVGSALDLRCDCRRG
jgi:hypothetical protein